MKEAKLVAVGRWAARGKAYIVAAASGRRRAHHAAAAFRGGRAAFE